MEGTYVQLRWWPFGDLVEDRGVSDARPGSSVRWIFLVASALATVFASVIVIRAGDVSALVHAGGRHANEAVTPDGLVVQVAERSYDGQFFYRQSASPLNSEPEFLGIRFDAAGLRYSRVGYPLLVYAITGGSVDHVPLGMIIVNVVAVGAVAAVGAAISRRHQRNRIAGFLFCLPPGIAIAVSLGLSDVVAVAAVLLFWLNFEKRRLILAACSLAFAHLTRESTLVVSVALALAIIGFGFVSVDGREPRFREARWWNPAFRNRHARLLLVPAFAVGLYSCWQVYVFVKTGETGIFSSGSANVGPPFAGFSQQLAAFDPRSGAGAVRLFVLASVASWLVLGGAALWNTRSSPLTLERLFLCSWICLAACLFTMLGPNLWSNYPNFGSAATELCCAAILGFVVLRPTFDRRIAFVPVAMSAVVALWSIWSTTPIGVP